MSQLEKWCPIIEGYCTRCCTFFTQAEDNPNDGSCQISEYFKRTTFSTYTETVPKKSKPLLEGSDKKV